MGDFDTDRGTYTPLDFRLWQENGILDITPKFQRRSVWKLSARSYFVDTLIRRMTVPPLYLRLAQDSKQRRVIRQVVDGQQRIRSVLEFIDDGYRLSKTLNAPWAGKRFTDLPQDQRDRITEFGFPTEIFKGISDKQVYEVFGRLNVNSIQLNKQELRNGRYFGLFKQACFSLALEYLEFWRHHRIFSEQNVARMLEVELTSELIIAGIDGMQDKKKTIDDFYDRFEEKYPDRVRDARRFRETMGIISETFNGDLVDSSFRRPPLFYSLYCAVYHHVFGLPGAQRHTPKKKLSTDGRESLRAAVVRLSNVLTQAGEPTESIPKRYATFVTACQRQTDNLIPRKVRFNALFDEAF